MFEPLFPNWSTPTTLVIILSLRLGFNILAVALTASIVGPRSPFTSILALCTICSIIIAVLALRPGTLGLRSSYVELSIQLGILVATAYVVANAPTIPRLLLLTLVLAGSIALGLIMIPLYGEAFVAP